MSEETGHSQVPLHVCPACGHSGTLVHEARDLPFEHRGRSTVVAAVRGVYCTACAEGFSDPKHPQDWQRYSEALTAFCASVNQQEAAEIRATRKKLRLRQADAGRLFGGGATAFSEYERGKTQPHKSTVLLLKLLNKHPELLAEIRQGQG